MVTPRLEARLGAWLASEIANLSLALLVAGIAADHVEPASPPNQLAILADPLDARTHLHETRSPSGGAFFGKLLL